MGISEIIQENMVFFNILAGMIILIFGIVIAQIFINILRKFIKRNDVDKLINKSALHLFSGVLRWSIYILFLNLALIKLNVPELNSWLIPVLSMIPALVGALILIAIGFFMALYLRDIIEDSKIEEAKMLSKIVFYFIIYVFVIFAFKTAMINQDKSTINIIIIILTAVSASGVTYHYAKKKELQS
jgi:flagellar biosynthesis protein FlhB